MRYCERCLADFSVSHSRTLVSGLAIQLRWLRKLAFTAGSYCGLESHPGDFRKGALVVEERKLPARPSVPFKLEAKQDSNLRARVTVILIIVPPIS